MSNQWFKLSFAVLACAAIAKADHENMKAPAMSGSFEGGIGHSWTPGATSGSQMFVDGLHLKNNFDVSSKTKVVLHNSFHVNSGSVGPGAALHNGNAYASGAAIGAAAGAAGLTFNNVAAYIQHECASGLYTSFGNMGKSFGMEGLWDRYDMHSYYYSPGHRANQARGWNYDLALKFHLVDIVPGTLEVQVTDGRNGRAAAPAFGAAARWHKEVKGNDWSFTPVLSGVFENWTSGPKDLGFTAGGMFKFGAIWANLEFMYAEATSAAPAKAWQIMAEPGFDLGGFDLSVKYTFYNVKTTAAAASTSDHEIAAGLSKTYSEDKYRVKLAYVHTNLSGKVGAHVNDFRLMFGTKW